MKAKVCREITGSAVATASSPSSAPIIPIRKSGNPPRELAKDLLHKAEIKSPVESATHSSPSASSYHTIAGEIVALGIVYQQIVAFQVTGNTLNDGMGQ
jgi:hypothetical protein